MPGVTPTFPPAATWPACPVGGTPSRFQATFCTRSFSSLTRRISRNGVPLQARHSIAASVWSSWRTLKIQSLPPASPSPAAAAL